MIENFVIFIPFGLLGGLILKKPARYRGAGIILLGFLMSLGIETLQLFLQSGACELNDLLRNALGTLVGWAVGRVLAVFLF